jgi:hypothetical protein
MSGGKFASLTASLLVRKGEAMPSPIVPTKAIPFPGGRDRKPGAKQKPDKENSQSGALLFDQSAAVREQKPRKAERETASSPEQSEKMRRLMVKLSSTEYATLGLIAVKKGTTRHHLLRMAFDEYLSLLVDEYGGSCQCIDSGCGCISAG